MAKAVGILIAWPLTFGDVNWRWAESLKVCGKARVNSEQTLTRQHDFCMEI